MPLRFPTAALCVALCLVAHMAVSAPAPLPSSPKEGPPASDLDPFKGAVKEVQQREGGGATILVERDAVGGMDLVRFHLSRTTPVMFSDKKKASASDLRAGQRVTVRTTSTIRDTCPPQMDADSVVIQSGKSR